MSKFLEARAKAKAARNGVDLAVVKRKMNYHYVNAGRRKPFPDEVSNYKGEDDSLNNQPREFKQLSLFESKVVNDAE